MKVNWNNRYLTISVYAILAVTVGIIVYKFLNGFSGYQRFVHAVFKIVKPIAYGIVIAYILNPIVNFCEQKIMPLLFKDKLSTRVIRCTSIAFAYFALSGVVAVLFYAAVPEIVESIDKIMASIPKYLLHIQDLFLEFLETKPGALIARKVDMSSLDLRVVLNETEVMLESSYEALKSTLSAFINALINLLLGITISVYLLCDKERYFAQIKKMMYAFFDTERVDRFYASCSDVKEIFNKFMYGKLIECVIIGGICYICLLIMRINNALLISFIIGITNFIPYFGPVIGTIPCVVLVFFDGKAGATNPTMALIFVIFILILQQIDSSIIGPKIQGKSVGISSFWVLVSVIVFGELFGIAGMLVSVPVFAVIYSMFRTFINRRLSK